MTDTIVRDNGAPGVSIVADTTAVLENVRVEHNAGDGVYISAVALRASATIRHSVLSHNGQAGAAAINTASPAGTWLVIEDSAIVNNSGEGLFAGGSSDGPIEAVVRRSTLAGNAYSGISAFTPSPSASIQVDAVDNTFTTNTTSQTKSDGAYVYVWLGRNEFQHYGYDTYTVNGGVSYTYGDNSGTFGYTFGNAPIKATGF